MKRLSAWPKKVSATATLADVKLVLSAPLLYKPSAVVTGRRSLPSSLRG